MDDLVFSEFIVKCLTANCENANIAISVIADDQTPIIICGVCGIQITDVESK